MNNQEWKPVVEALAAKVGFQKRTIGALKGASDLGDTAALWSAPYAQLLVISDVATTPACLREATRKGQEWLDVSCIVQERASHSVVDAYLVVVLAEALPDEMWQMVREIELDPVACRKHVAWPLRDAQDDATWRLLLRVTSLGLPDSPISSGMTNTPTLGSDFEKDLLEDVKELKGRAAARQHATPLDEGVGK